MRKILVLLAVLFIGCKQVTTPDIPTENKPVEVSDMAWTFKSITNPGDSVCSSNRGITLVSSGGVLLRSTDLVVWNTINPGASGVIKAIFMDANISIISGIGGTLRHSTDRGVTWANCLKSFSGYDIYDIKKLGNIYWGVGRKTTDPYSGSIFRSYDGVNWSMPFQGFSGPLYGLNTSGTTIIAVGVVSGGSGGSLIVKSANSGETFSVVPTSSTYGWGSVASNGAGLWVSTRISGIGPCYYSADNGDTWILSDTLTFVPHTIINFNGVFFASSLYDTSGVAHGDIYMSETGETWEIYQRFGGGSIYGMFFSLDLHVISGGMLNTTTGFIGWDLYSKSLASGIIISANYENIMLGKDYQIASGVLRYKAGSGVIESFTLVSPSDPIASPLRIQTMSGIMAVAKYEGVL